MEYEPKYTISLQGKEFVLSKSQVEFDSPNYFTACFLGDFYEAKTRRLEIFRDPDLFGIIMTYLSGYNVLPLNERSIPATMSPDNALQNLRADAVFYQLDGLVQGCDDFVAAKSVKLPPKRRYLILGSKLTVPDHIYAENEEMQNPFGMLPPNAHWQTYVSEERLGEAPLNEMETPQSLTGFDGLKLISRIEKFASQSMDKYDPRRWKLVGWHEKAETIQQHAEVAFDHEWLVVFEDLESDRRSSE